MSEQWRDIKSFEGLYQVSTYGQVKRLSKTVVNEGLKGKTKQFVSKEMILKPARVSKGYLGVTLTKDGVRYPRKIHRLVAETFIDNPLNKSQVNHIDCDKTNNRIENLEWVTQQENIDHAKINGLITCEKATLKKYRKVSQFDLSMNLIREWNSLKEAGEFLGKPSSNISKCCNGEIKTAYGYVWKYTEGEKQ